MTNPSPGPGWWMASDGNWYPQRWEYQIIVGENENLFELKNRMENALDAEGQKGWELVNTSTTHTQVASKGKYGGGATLFFQYSMTCTMKCPIAP